MEKTAEKRVQVAAVPLVSFETLSRMFYPSGIVSLLRDGREELEEEPYVSLLK